MSGPPLPSGFVPLGDLLNRSRSGYYTTTDGRVVRTAKEAIQGNLSFENTANTGSGCGQDPENVVEPPKK